MISFQGSDTFRGPERRVSFSSTSRSNRVSNTYKIPVSKTSRSRAEFGNNRCCHSHRIAWELREFSPWTVSVRWATQHDVADIVGTLQSHGLVELEKISIKNVFRTNVIELTWGRCGGCCVS